MVLIAVSIFVYWQFSATPLMDSICLIAIGFLIYGPVMLIGVHALDLAPKKAAGTAARRRISNEINLLLQLYI